MEKAGKSSLSQLETEAKRLASMVGAPVDMLPTFGKPTDLAYVGTKYVDFDGRYHLVFVERGKEYEHRISDDPEELLYWLLDGITFALAGTYELQNRIPSQDIRRVLFNRQLELLSLVNEKWKDRAEREQRNVLKRHPFDDQAAPRRR